MRQINGENWEREFKLYLETDEGDRTKTTHRYRFIDNLPINEAEKDELQEHFEARRSEYWCHVRDLWLNSCQERLEEKKERAMRKLVYGERISAIHDMDEGLAHIAQLLRNEGYSCAAISEASRHAVSQGWVIEYTEGAEGRRVRGQVIEMLDEESDFDLRKWQLKGSYNNNHGKGLQQAEKDQICALYKKGYSIAEIAVKVKRSASSVRRQVEKNGLR